MYDIFYINNLKDENYKKIKDRFFTVKFATSIYEAQKKSVTKFFYIVFPDIIIDPEFNFDYIPDDYSQDIPHVFLNGEFYDGIALIPKSYNISNNEINYRFFVNKKEIDIVASTPKPYDIVNCDTYEDYLEVKNNVKTDIFYIVWNDINVDYDFSYKIPYYNKNIVHVFKNGKHFDGMIITSKHTELTKKEFDYRFFTNKKEIDIVASTPKPYEVVFISYNESNADRNYESLLKKAPYAKRVHSVKGIHQAHIVAAKKCSTEMIWIVDADAVLVDEFKFDYQVETWNKDAVHVWRSKNPVNDLVYGYGGIKLFPRGLTINMDISKPDMTTSISSKFKAVAEISNITAFNTDPFSTWKSAFRECCKLASKIIDRQKSNETEERLNVWCTIGHDKPFGEFAILGAKAGREYGYQNKDNVEALKKINDFDWLKEQYEKY